MNDRLTENILSEARASLAPSLKDRERLHRKVMGAVGAAAVTAAAGTAAAKVTSGALATGIPAGVITGAKLTVGGLLMAGGVILGVAGWSGKLTTSSADDKAATQVALIQRDIFHPPGVQPFLVHALPELNAGASDDSVDSASTHDTTAAIPEDGSSQRAVAANTTPLTPHEKNKKSLRKSPPLSDNMLLREIALIRKASVALRQNNFSTAMRLLHQYRQQFPSGTMRQEGDGLIIQALCGDRKLNEARSAYRTFTKRYGAPPVMFQVDEQCIAK